MGHSLIDELVYALEGTCVHIMNIYIYITNKKKYLMFSYLTLKEQALNGAWRISSFKHFPNISTKRVCAV